MEKLNKETTYGSIDISKDAIATLVYDEVLSSYGVAGLVDKNVDQKGVVLLDEENLKKGIEINKDGKLYAIDVHIAIIFPCKISEVINELQKKIKYNLEMTFGIKFKAINIFVDGLINQ